VLGDDPRRSNPLPALNFDAPPHACPFARYTTEQAEAERRRHLRMIAERDARRARRAQVIVTRFCRVRLCGGDGVCWLGCTVWMAIIHFCIEHTPNCAQVAADADRAAAEAMARGRPPPPPPLSPTLVDKLANPEKTRLEARKAVEANAKVPRRDER